MPRPHTYFYFLLAVLLAGLAPRAVLAADPQPYEVRLARTGNSGLDAALHDSARLISLQKSSPVGGFALVQRARQDRDRFAIALHSFGFYKAEIALTIGGRALDDPTVVDTINRAPANRPILVDVKFTLGPQFHIGHVAIHGAVPPEIARKLGVSSGQPAIAADVLAARDRLLSLLREDGYPLAKVDLPPALLRPADHALDVTFEVSTGQQAEFGDITVTGLQNMHESYVRRRLLLHTGQRFSPSAIEKARQDLLSVGTFSSVRIEPADHLDASGRLPLNVIVTERPLRAVDFGAGYSTDLGVNFSAEWHHRNLFGNAEQLNLLAAVQLGGSALIQPGYHFGAQFLKPDFLARDQTLEIDLDAVKQSLQAYDQRALLQKIAIDRKLTPQWSVTVGISGEQEDITQQGVRTHFNLIGLPLGVKYDNTNNLLDPTRGIRASITATPTEALGSNNTSFVILQAAASTYIDLSGSGRSVLALRGLVGEVPGTGTFSLPPDQRFYAGGSATVRGFRYQSIGPRFPNNDPTGGTGVAAGTVEFRQRILGNYGAVAFVDAGQVNANGTAFTSTWRVGAGVGFRYYTSIGPIRLDVAVPLNRQPGGDSFELYIGIGQAF
jgi:translocation and assembly module TamA